MEKLMTTEHFIVTTRVIIIAKDAASRVQAKNYLKTHFYRVQAGASHNELEWEIQVAGSKLAKSKQLNPKDTK